MVTASAILPWQQKTTPCTSCLPIEQPEVGYIASSFVNGDSVFNAFGTLKQKEKEWIAEANTNPFVWIRTGTLIIVPQKTL